MKSRRRPITLADVLLILLVAGLIVRVGVPQYRQMKRRAVVRSVVADLDVMQKAAQAARASGKSMSRPDAPGHPPPELAAQLPPGFRFARSGFSYSFVVVPYRDSAGAAPSHGTPNLLTVTVSLDDSLEVPMLVHETSARYSAFGSGRTVTLVMLGP